MERNSRLAVAGQTAALLAAALICAGTPSSALSADAKGTARERTASPAEISRGRYMMIVGSCNDCHTAGFAPSEGNVPEKDWLLGSGPLGFRGPWGTTYAPNLRETMARMSESEWVKMAKTLKTRPPMPWFNLKQWKEGDLKALYQYIRQLGPVGASAKAGLPPGQEPPPPYIQWPSPPK